jgi:hypothetical protein
MKYVLLIYPDWTVVTNRERDGLRALGVELGAVSLAAR